MLTSLQKKTAFGPFFASEPEWTGAVPNSSYNSQMPTISMFYGILVSMFFEDTDRHHLAHIHVRYAGDKAAIAIEDGRVLAGSFPPKQLKMVQAWIEIQALLNFKWVAQHEG